MSKHITPSEVEDINHPVVDSTDKAILKELSNDPTITETSIAGYVGLEPTTVADRISKLKRNGIIQDGWEIDEWTRTAEVSLSALQRAFDHLDVARQDPGTPWHAADEEAHKRLRVTLEEERAND
jgi:Mn-dependent DtxR family transcriptional regulator